METQSLFSNKQVHNYLIRCGFRCDGWIETKWIYQAQHSSIFIPVARDQEYFNQEEILKLFTEYPPNVFFSTEAEYDRFIKFCSGQ
jgi:hypothetical protein